MMNLDSRGGTSTEDNEVASLRIQRVVQWKTIPFHPFGFVKSWVRGWCVASGRRNAPLPLPGAALLELEGVSTSDLAHPHTV